MPDSEGLQKVKLGWLQKLSGTANPAGVCAIAAVYLGCALVAVIVIAIMDPPFMVADEMDHFFRAYQISHGGIIGHKYTPFWSGGKIPAAFMPLITRNRTLTINSFLHLTGTT